MADVFLSYAREDWQRVKPLAEDLEAQGWSVWWDTRMRAGQHFDEVIEKQLAATRCVIVVWTEASVKSQWVRAEAANALEQDKLIPVFLDKVRPPLLFRNVQGLYLVAWKGSTDDLRFQRLIEDVAQLAGPPRAPAPGGDVTTQPLVQTPPPLAAAKKQSLKSTDSGRSVSGSVANIAFVEPDMVRIQPGTFLMGSAQGESPDEDERPHREVRIARPFGIGRYAVTFDEYDAFTKATQREPAKDEGWGRGRRPVINVSWDDAVAYARWLSERTGKRYRLPSEAEWEYAARAGTQTRWSFGDQKRDLRDYAWFDGNSGGQTHPVGEKQPNPCGLDDVHGNVWEWVEDCWHENYQGAPTDGRAWLIEGGGECRRRVIRGGSWCNRSRDLRSAYRFGNTADDRLDIIGFRLAQDL